MNEFVEALTSLLTNGSFMGRMLMDSEASQEETRQQAALYFKVRDSLGLRASSTHWEVQASIVKGLEEKPESPIVEINRIAKVSHPDTEAAESGGMRILSNQVRCKKCDTQPFSAHRHDFKRCACGAVAVDGGMSYLRRVGDMSEVVELSIEAPVVLCKEALYYIDMALDESWGEEVILGSVLTALRIPVTEASYQAAIDKIKWALETGRNALGILCAIVIGLRDAGVDVNGLMWEKYG